MPEHQGQQQHTLHLLQGLLRKGLYCGLILIPILCFFINDPASSGSLYGLLRILILLTFAFSVLHYYLDKTHVWYFSGAAIILLIFGLYMTASGWGRSLTWSGIMYSRDFIFAALYLAAFQQALSNRYFIKAAAAALVIGSVLIALCGIDQHMRQFDAMIKQVESDPDRYLHGMQESHRRAWLVRLHSREVFGPYAHPNTYGGVMGAMALFSAAWALSIAQPVRNKKWILPLGLASLFCLYGLLISRSKGGWAAFGAGVLIFIWLRIRGRIVIKGLITTAALILVIVVWSSTTLLDKSIEIRGGYWQGAFAMIRSQPLYGVGPGNFGLLYPQYKPFEAQEVQYPHNIYLRVAAEGGLGAFILFVSFWFVVLFLRWREPDVANNHNQSDRLIISNAAIAAVAFFLVHSLVDGELAVPGVFLLIMVLSGLALNHVSMVQYNRPPRAFICLPIIIIGWLAMYLWYWEAFAGGSLLDRAEALQSREPVRTGDLQKSIELCEQGHREYPHQEKFIEYAVRAYRSMGHAHISKTIRLQEQLCAQTRIRIRDWSLLAELYSAAGRRQEAIETYQHCLLLYPSNPRYLMYLSRLYSSIGDKKRSRAHAGLALELVQNVKDSNVRFTDAETKELEKLAIMQTDFD